MDKLILKNGAEVEIEEGYDPGRMVTYISEYGELQALSEKLTDENLSSAKRMSGETELVSYMDMTLSEPHFHLTKRKAEIKVIFGLRKKTTEEIQQPLINEAITYLSDEVALSVKDLYAAWEADPEGYPYKEGERRRYGSGLWKAKKDHAKQADWYPGADPTLWGEIVENHAGTLEDPIPVPESVAASGFEYEYGLHYLDGGKIYLAIREGKESGEKETLYYPPSQLVGQYFKYVKDLEEAENVD